METDVDPTATLDGLRAAAEPLRWRILRLLADEELCVCHLVETLDAPQSLVSHHLRVLRDASLVERGRVRDWTYYLRAPTAVEELGRRLIDLGNQAAAAGTARRPCC